MSIKNRINQLLLLTVVTFSFAACKKTENGDADKLFITEKINTSPTITTKETIILNPQVTGPSPVYEWIENDKVISTDNLYVFNREIPGDYVITLKLKNASSSYNINYKIKVVGVYTKGILLINSTDLTGTGGGDISYLDENENLKLNVFSMENNGAKLSTATSGTFRYGNQLFLSASRTPFIQVMNNETLKLGTSNISTSSVTGIGYFATTDGKTGYVVGGSASKRALYTVDLVNKTISSTALSGTSVAPLIPITTVGNIYLTPASKNLVKIDNGSAQTLFTYAETVAGVVKTANKQIWVGVAKGGSQAAKMVRLDENFTVQETVDLGSSFLLPANGILTASGTDEYIYWWETATNEFCRFSTVTKTAEVFVNSIAEGITFATAWKVNPKTGELYLADTPGVFSGIDTYSDLYIYSKDKKLRKKIAKAGFQIVDVVFPK